MESPIPAGIKENNPRVLNPRMNIPPYPWMNEPFQPFTQVAFQNE